MDTGELAMTESLFDETKEKPQTEPEETFQPEVQIGEIHQPDAQREPEILPVDEKAYEVPDSNADETGEPLTSPDAQTHAGILPPTEIQILQDAETIDETVEQPEIPASGGVKTIDEFRMQSNISNSMNPAAGLHSADETAFSQKETGSESLAETARKSGLAMSAAIALFGSVVFMLIIGWFADLLLGTSPWGKVGGIVLGSIIGFLQFFRMTSQILKNKDR